YRLYAHYVITVHSGYFITPLQLRNSLLRNKQRPMEGFNGNTHFAVLSWPQNVAWVREESCGLDGAGTLVHLAPGKGVLSLVWKHRSVGEHQLQRRCRIRWLVLFREPEIFLLADRECDLTGVNRGNGRYGVRRGRAHQIADLSLRIAGDTING